jgi:hypothetical protein
LIFVRDRFEDEDDDEDEDEKDPGGEERQAWNRGSGS